MRAKSKKSGKNFSFGSPVLFPKRLDGGSGASAVWQAERKNGGGENSFYSFLYFWPPASHPPNAGGNKVFPVKFGERQFLVYNLSSFGNHYLDTDFNQYVSSYYGQKKNGRQEH